MNVSELVTLEAVQRDLGLGPNGGLVYCMEYLAANTDWLQEKLAPLLAANTYLIFDCPGQVELFNVHDALQKVVAFLTDSLRIRHALIFRARDAVLCLLTRTGTQADRRAPGGQPPVR